MTNRILTLLTIVFALGCAKNRDVERVRAGDTQNILPKQAYLGGADSTGVLAQKSAEDGRAIWFSKLTVVDTSDSPNGHMFVGFQGDVKAGYFDFTETNLQFRSIKGVLEGKENENIKNSVLLSWDIDHLDYTLDENDGQTINKEIEDNFKTWEQKKYFRVNWGAQLKNEYQMLPSASFAMFSCWEPVSVRSLENTMKIEEDHIGFNLEVVYQQMPACASGAQWSEGDFNFTVTFKYSFKKVTPSDYQPKYFTNEQDPARYKYGHFQTVRKVINPKNGRPHNIFMENRWAEKTQYFFFVKGFPEQHKWMWSHENKHSVLAQTNSLLESIGSKLRFEIYDYNANLETGANNGPEREFGDLRYSFVNFIEEIEAGGTPLGYGPSDTNPFTGEIIAANTMVWTGMLGYYLELVENVSDSSENESSLLRQMEAALKTPNSGDVSIDSLVSEWDQNDKDGIGSVFRKMAQKTRYGFPYWNSYTNNEVGEVVVPTLVEKYGVDGVKAINSHNPEWSTASYYSQVVDLGTSRVPFDFDQRFIDGKNQVMVLNPLSSMDMSWLQNFAAFTGSASGTVAPSKGVSQILKVLKNLGKATDHNHQGPGSVQDIAQAYQSQRLQDIKVNQEGHCILDMDEFGGGFAGFLKASKLNISDPNVRRDILNTVLYRVSMHEFGHNLNLRHNFYGSVDQKNFGIEKEGSIANFPGSNGLASLNTQGEVMAEPLLGDTRVQISSSVMDYLRLEDEINVPWAWEDYDVAAIRDSYEPKGFNDENRLYLYCTDEHTLTSAICNRHDLGTTPSQILMSQIRSYDERYETRNKRFGRAYWNTGGYPSAIFGVMRSMKEFLPMWRSAFAEDIVKGELEEMGIDNKVHDRYVEQLNREMREVMKLTMAFYQGVVQQSRGDRDYRSEYDETTGALKQIGIISDKIFAMMMLAGDDPIYYNPNRIMIHNSYLTYADSPNLGEFSERIWRNIITDRNIAMEPWFINFSRFLYAKNATNSTNEDQASLIDLMKIVRIDNAQELLEQYGLKLESDRPALETTLPKSKGTFSKGDKVVVVQIDGKYYMTDVSQGHVTYALFQTALDKLTGAGDDDASIQQFKKDVREFYWLYDFSTSGGFQQ